MPVYRYKASKLDGKTVRGEMQAVNKAALHEQLQAQNLYLTSYEESQVKSSAKKLNSRQLADFCRELGMMLGAGVPLVRALSIMAKRDIKPEVRDVYNGLYRSLKQGAMLSEAMARQVNVFPDLLVSMIRASEASGAMDQTALKMAEHYDKSYRLNKKVRSATTYPIMLACVTVVVLLVVFLVVLPQFFELFSSFDAELPGITQFFLNFSLFLQNYWVWVLIGALLLVLVLRIVLNIPKVRIAVDRFKLHLPAVGRLLRIIYTARFARTFSSCYASGISIISALSNTKDTVGNAYIASQFPAMIRSVRDGGALSTAVKNVDGFDNKLAATILIGEETGKLYEMLNSIADAFDYDSEVALGQLTAMIEPVMIVIMALVIGSVIIAVMLPMTQLYNTIGSVA